MKACTSCGCYCRPADDVCPHCDTRFGLGMPRATAAALLLGLTMGLNGCVGQSKYGVPDSGVQAEYGVPDTAQLDQDGDGWTPADGDCNDTDVGINPDATEIVGDDVDSNCNDELDT